MCRSGLRSHPAPLIDDRLMNLINTRYDLRGKISLCLKRLIAFILTNGARM